MQATGTISTPWREAAATTSASPIQKMKRSAVLDKPSAMLAPRISATVSARPMLPA